jgi:hypothetical protein
LSTFHLARVHARPAFRLNGRPWWRAFRAALLALHDSRRRMALRVLRDHSHLLDGTAGKPRH